MLISKKCLNELCTLIDSISSINRHEVFFLMKMIIIIIMMIIILIIIVMLIMVLILSPFTQLASHNLSSLVEKVKIDDISNSWKGTFNKNMAAVMALCGLMPCTSISKITNRNPLLHSLGIKLYARKSSLHPILTLHRFLHMFKYLHIKPSLHLEHVWDN